MTMMTPLLNDLDIKHWITNLDKVKQRLIKNAQLLQNESLENPSFLNDIGINNDIRTIWLSQEVAPNKAKRKGKTQRNRKL